MQFSRRTFLASTGATLALPTLSLAETMIGNHTLNTVSDGNLVMPGDFAFSGLPQDELSTILEATGVSRERVTPDCNLALYRDGENTVLFDVGSGPDFMPTAGKIVDSLDAMGLAPEDVTHVLFTHAHPDHIWGLLDDFDEPLFYEATYMMGRAEWDYWWNPETVNTIGEARTVFAAGAKRRMQAIEDAVVLFDDGDEVLPGISAVGTFGHTPGHMGFEVRQANEAALIVGDAIGNHHTAFARPDWASGSDQDADTGIATRKMLFDRIVNEKMKIVGFHLPHGGMGHVDTMGDGYKFLADV